MKLWQNTQFTTAILFCFYNVIVRDSEPIRLLESPRSLSVYILIIYISPATSICKFKWVVVSCLAFLLPKVIWNSYCQGATYDLVQVC